MTKSAPTTTTTRQVDLDSWMEFVERGSRTRARVEMLISVKGLLKPVTLAQRFVIKSRQVGIGPTLRIVAERLRQRVFRGVR